MAVLSASPTRRLSSRISAWRNSASSRAEKRFQNGDMTFIKELAHKVLSVLERPARSSERLETAVGETEDGQNLHPEIIPDPNMGQRELTSDLITDTSVLADPDSGICEIPEIQEPDAVSIIEGEVCISPDIGVGMTRPVLSPI
ncbi:microtubule-associated serine/threonine-protein kinase 4-like [Phyllobates terribilis]|uniref:microtubule-associated serine/threonine-protein kinase 4-like n=1 Tax=Phyllobates terribilis TaxID=111132 RepID=UPI003CCB265D